MKVTSDGVSSESETEETEREDGHVEALPLHQDSPFLSQEYVWSRLNSTHSAAWSFRVVDVVIVSVFCTELSGEWCQSFGTVL